MTRYRVWVHDYHEGPEEAVKVDASSARWAAENGVEKIDRDSGGDLLIPDSDQVLAHVIDPDGAVTDWEVFADTTVTYTSRVAKVSP